MTKPSFVYVIYISTEPERVWQAITDPSLSAEYWGGLKADSAMHANVSAWTPGARWEHQRTDEARTLDIVGTVVESSPPRRLVITWARPKEADDATKHSRVTFDIESQADRLVKLTVTHEDLEKDPPMLNGISNGWPTVLSNMKTFLETGRPLPRIPVGT